MIHSERSSSTHPISFTVNEHAHTRTHARTHTHTRMHARMYTRYTTQARTQARTQAHTPRHTLKNRLNPGKTLKNTNDINELKEKKKQGKTYNTSVKIKRFLTQYPNVKHLIYCNQMRRKICTQIKKIKRKNF